MSPQLLLLCAASLSLLACESDDEKTSSETGNLPSPAPTRVKAEIQAIATSNSSSMVLVSLQDSKNHNSQIKLEEGDTLTATLSTGELTKLSFDPTWELPTGYLSDGTAGTTITVDIKRTASPNLSNLWFPTDDIALPDLSEFFIDTSASTIFPADFSIGQPLDQQVFTTHTDAITLTWSNAPTSNTMNLIYSTTCAGEKHIGTLPIGSDDGNASFTINNLLPINHRNTNCDISISLDRKSVTLLNSPFADGSSITGTQQRRVNIQYRP